jgi:hypothetical protein
LKIFPWVWNGQILLMGAEHDFVQADWITQYTLRLRSSPIVGNESYLDHDSSSNRLSLAKPQDVAHVILAHESPDKVASLMQHASTLSPEYRFLLAYGGPESLFASIPYNNKVFLTCPSLRGPSHKMTHHELLTSAFRHFINLGAPYPKWVFFSESDCLPLKIRYLDEIVRLADEVDAGFLGKEIRDVTLTNCGFYAAAANENLAGPLADDKAIRDLRYFHCLGCAFLIRWEYLEKMQPFLKTMSGIYFEIMFPTVAAKVGAKLVSADSHGNSFSYIRYRPVLTQVEIGKAIQSGAPLAHPVKDDGSRDDTDIRKG